MSIERIRSSRGYSQFMLRTLVEHVNTVHCLVVQWDGFVINAGQWDSSFLQYDYIGAPWPQFGDGHDVGNGGFSLRSRKLLEACVDPRFQRSHPEDVAICRYNRALLEQDFGIRFADPSTADKFAFERKEPTGDTFGFHGIFNIIPVLGSERFWEIYQKLDNRSTAATDYWILMRQLGESKHSMRRRCKLTFDVLKEVLLS